MSVDYYVCEHCGETFCDADDFVYCECGNRWCCLECAYEDGEEYETGEGIKLQILSWRTVL